ncbi:unnamed protein product [Urochloa decumbens]|uniref:BHLH domain-containing protein n=1 Tax=Urochloa decumbens TaxID=240449 RepID=A0ABC8XIL8_9POAL
MEDSSQFMQWALSTLLHEQPPPSTPAPAAAYDNGCDTDSESGGGGGGCVTSWSPPQHSVMCATAPGSCSSGSNQQPLSWDFNSASVQLTREAQPYSDAAAAAVAESGGGVSQMKQHGSLPTRRSSAARIPASSSSSAANSQDHIIAERKRREKINQRFIELSTVIPGLKKMDKATILSDATRYVRELQEKVKARQQEGSGRGRGRGMESSAVLAKKPCIVVDVDDDEDGGSAPSYAAAATRNALPEIEARISDGNVVMLRIHCQDAKGVLVRLLAEVEGQHLRITHTNVVQFSANVLIINIMAKVEEGFNTTADDIARRLNAALHAAACQNK